MKRDLTVGQYVDEPPKNFSELLNKAALLSKTTNRKDLLENYCPICGSCGGHGLKMRISLENSYVWRVATTVVLLFWGITLLCGDNNYTIWPGLLTLGGVGGILEFFRFKYSIPKKKMAVARDYHAHDPLITSDRVSNIPSYFLHFIDDAEKRLIGVGTRFSAMRARLDLHLFRNNVLCKEFQIEIETSPRGDAPEYLIEGLRRSRQIVSETEVALNKLKEFEDKIKAFYFARRQEVLQKAGVSVRHLALCSRLSESSRDHEILMPKVDEVILDTLVKMVGQLSDFQQMVDHQAEESGVYLAAATPVTGDLVKDTKMMTEAIERFVAVIPDTVLYPEGITEVT